MQEKSVTIIFGAILSASLLFFFGDTLSSFLLGNSDTLLCINSSYDLYRGLFSWNELMNNFSDTFFPSLFPNLLKVFFELFGFPLISIFSMIILFIFVVFYSYKITAEIIGSRNRCYRWIIFIISLFSIANEMVRGWLIFNLVIVWGMLFFLIAIYYFFKFKNNLENKSYIILLLIALLFVCIDFHALLLFITFIFYFLFVELFIRYDLLREKVKIILFFRNIAVAFFIFLALNSYWIFNNAYSVFAGNSVYAKYAAERSQTDSVLGYIANNLSKPASNFILSTAKDHSGKFYPASFAHLDVVASFIFLLLAVFSIFLIRKEKNKKRKIHLIVLWILYIIFFTFSLGPDNPTGIFTIFWDYAPGFKLFRDFFKFNRVILPILIILVSYSSIGILDLLKNKKRKIIFSGLIFIIILIKFVPYYFLFPLYKPFKIPNYYYQINQHISQKKIDSKVQIMPVISWMQTYEWSNQNYNMQEPLKYFTPKPIFYNDVTYEEGYNDKLNKQLQWYLISNDKLFLNYENIRSVGFLVARNDLSLDFLEKKKADPTFIGQKEILDAADSSSFLTDKTEIGKLSIYELNKDQFLPHFYTTQNSIVSHRTIDALPGIISSPDWQIRSAVFFRGQNDGKEDALDKLKAPSSPPPSPRAGEGADSSAPCEDEGGVALPTLEFKKINPTKYRVRVHGASGVFPVVFSESFHEGWKVYLAKPSNFQFSIFNFQSISNEQISKYKVLDGNVEDPKVANGDGASQASVVDSYKILDGNEEDQATKSELADFIKNGWVTALGDQKEKTIEHKKWDPSTGSGQERLDYVEKYSIDFVSKNFQGTIQNDNLPSGNIFETWFRRPIENNANHLMANGYANSWVIDANSVCNPKNNSSNSSGANCVRNADGSYDFEMVVEFWPQRLFYIGLFISGMTLLGCIGYLGYDYRKRKKSLGSSGKEQRI